MRLVEVLKLIEDNKTDQHEASVLFGRILKEMYIDSAVKQGDNLDLKHNIGKEIAAVGKKMTWTGYKNKS